MGTTTSTQTYLLSEFPNTKCNVQILEAEIVAASLTVNLVSTPQLTGSSVVCTFEDLLTSGDVTSLDAVVAAHQGDDFGSTLIKANSTGQSENSTTDWVSKLSLTADPLPSGVYLVSWAIEHEMAAIVSGTAGQVRLTWNAASVYEDTWDLNQPHNFGGAIPMDLDAGAEPVVALEFKKLGAPAATVYCRQARLSIAKIG